MSRHNLAPFTLVALTLLVAATSVRSMSQVEGLVAGLLGGALLGTVGLKRTRFEISGQKDCYVPDPWIGLALTTLLLGRLIYRFMQIYPAMQAVAMHADSSAGFASMQRSPLTLGMFGLLFGYYICYYAGILMHRRQALARLQATAVP